MWRLTYASAKEFAHIINSINVLTDEAQFVVRDGLYLRALDASRTAMVDLAIPRESFTEFPDGEYRISLNFKELKKILSHAKSGDMISFEVFNKVRIKLIGKSVRSITLPMIEATSEDLSTPKVDYTATIKMASDGLETAINDASAISDEVKLEANDTAFVVSATSDRGEVEVKFEKNGDYVFEFDVREPATAKYSLEYLTDMVKKATKISDIVTVKLATSKPLFLSFDIPAGGKISYYLAPRID